MAKTENMRAVTQIPRRFAYQSYFDSALLQGAILNQAQGSPIVASTLQSAQTPGVGVALHPSSESPVAIRFRGGSADSAEVILTPGQKLNVGSFESFDWGLPFGWLGGGTSLLYVLHNDKAAADFPTATISPIMYHRTRIAVTAALGAVVSNWPNAFPWDNAIRGVDANPQGGSAIVNINPTHTLFRLRSAIAAPTVLTVQARGIDELDTDATGSTVATVDITTVDLTFPGIAPAVAGFPIAIMQAEIARLAGPFAAFQVLDLNVGNPLAGAFIDVVRYGTLD